ncbi:MAG: hypothetical protein AABX71_03035 [Nanoarchaeota archaeon]
MLKMKKAVGGSTITWIVGTLLILLIMFVFLVSTGFSGIIFGRAKVIEVEEFSKTASLQSFFGFLNTKVEVEGEEKNMLDLFVFYHEKGLHSDLIQTKAEEFLNPQQYCFKTYEGKKCYRTYLITDVEQSFIEIGFRPKFSSSYFNKARVRNLVYSQPVSNPGGDFSIKLYISIDEAGLIETCEGKKGELSLD